MSHDHLEVHYITNSLSVAEHVHNVIISCAQALHDLKSSASTRHGQCLTTDDLPIGYHRQADLRLQCLVGVHQCN